MVLPVILSNPDSCYFIFFPEPEVDLLLYFKCGQITIGWCYCLKTDYFSVCDPSYSYKDSEHH